MEPSGERVTERLEKLRESYPGVPVEQTMVQVAPADHDQVRAVASVVDARVRVENDAGETLHIREGSDWELPHVQVPEDEEVVTTTRQVVGDETGVEPLLEDVRLVTITGYQCVECADEEDRIYRLGVDFIGTPESGTPDDGAAWRALDE